MTIFVPSFQEVVGSTTATTYDVPTAGNKTAVEDWTPATDATTPKEMLGSFVDAIFWYYDWFPVWLTLLHVIVRIVAVYSIYRILNPLA